MPSLPRDYTVAALATDGSEIRKFSDSTIQANIDRVLAQAPSGQKAAIVLYTDFKGEVRAGIFGKKKVKLPGLLGKLGLSSAEWTYGGTVTYDYKNKDLKGEAQTAIWF